MKFATAVVLVVGGTLASMVDTSAQAVSARLTADNHYQLFYGNADGSLLTFVGQNEATSAGNPGTYNWSEAESFTFTPSPGQYLYVVAWDSGGAAGWLGQFSSIAGTLLSKPANWSYYQSGIANPGESQPSMLGAVVSNIAAAQAGSQWLSNPASSGLNGVSPWGTISGISSSAEWLTVPNNGGPVYIFRSEALSVPEASTNAALVGSTLAVGWMLWRRRKIAAKP
jgi:hypothetical protein